MGPSLTMDELRDLALPDLIDAARSEQVDAFEEIVRRFRGTAHAVAYFLIHDQHLAQDIAQEAFVEAYLGLDNLREPAAFAA